MSTAAALRKHLKDKCIRLRSSSIKKFLKKLSLAHRRKEFAHISCADLHDDICASSEPTYSPVSVKEGGGKKGRNMRRRLEADV